MHKHRIDARLSGLRTLNFAAIILFLIGVCSGATFFFSSKGNLNVTNTEDSKIILQEKSIEIGKDAKTKVTIKIDSIRKTILINQ